MGDLRRCGPSLRPTPTAPTAGCSSGPRAPRAGSAAPPDPSTAGPPRSSATATPDRASDHPRPGRDRGPCETAAATSNAEAASSPHSAAARRRGRADERLNVRRRHTAPETSTPNARATKQPEAIHEPQHPRPALRRESAPGRKPLATPCSSSSCKPASSARRCLSSPTSAPLIQVPARPRGVSTPPGPRCSHPPLRAYQLSGNLHSKLKTDVRSPRGFRRCHRKRGPRSIAPVSSPSAGTHTGQSRRCFRHHIATPFGHRTRAANALTGRARSGGWRDYIQSGGHPQGRTAVRR